LTSAITTNTYRTDYPAGMLDAYIWDINLAESISDASKACHIPSHYFVEVLRRAGTHNLEELLDLNIDPEDIAGVSTSFRIIGVTEDALIGQLEINEASSAARDILDHYEGSKVIEDAGLLAMVHDDFVNYAILRKTVDGGSTEVVVASQKVSGSTDERQDRQYKRLVKHLTGQTPH
jgi:hypothetical protein